jgi:NAD(P)H-dependent FMN reductase
VTRIGVILGSTRPGRRGEPVARWVIDEAGRRSDADFELVDLADYPLPHLDEPLPPSMGQYQNSHTQTWAETIGRFDGYVFVTPEYNHSTSAVLKNAIDFLYAQWNNKAMGVVSYGTVGGARAAEHLRLVAGELSLFTDFETSVSSNPVRIKPRCSTRFSGRSSPGARRSRHCGKSLEQPRSPDTIALGLACPGRPAA